MAVVKGNVDRTGQPLLRRLIYYDLRWRDR